MGTFPNMQAAWGLFPLRINLNKGVNKDAKY